MTAICVRPMLEADLPAVLAVQAACYPPAMNESAHVILARLRAAPETAWVACRGDAVQAYLAAYPGELGKVTPLDSPFKPATAADCLYVHDLAVAPLAGGLGLGQRLVMAALQKGRALGLANSALVCVQDAHAFWYGRGYRDASPIAAASRSALASYPGGGRYMLRHMID